MATITLSIPDDLYRRMKKRRELRWSEIARKAFEEALEEFEGTVPAEKFIEHADIDVNSINWEEMEAKEWERIKNLYTTQTSS